MRDPESYRGARRAEAKRYRNNNGAGKPAGSFVDLWREIMPEDGAKDTRGKDWRGYTDKEARRARST